MKLTIGNVTLDNNVILAPMAGVTDLPYRVLCREQGCGLVCMEMVSAKAVLYKNRNTKELLEVDPRERPVSLQLFGSDPEILSKIAGELADDVPVRPSRIILLSGAAMDGNGRNTAALGDLRDLHSVDG